MRGYKLLQQPVERPDTLCYRVRRAMKMSQAEFSEYLQQNLGGDGPAENTVQRWEAGTEPKWYYHRELERLARAHKVNVNKRP